MNWRKVIQTGAVVWAIVGAGIAVGAVRDVNPDARVVVVVASILGPAAAIAAAVLAGRRRDRWAGALLVLSAATPTYFAVALNLPALLVGLYLLVGGKLQE